MAVIAEHPIEPAGSITGIRAALLRAESDDERITERTLCSGFA